jgi:hypothetical protein
MRLTELKSRWPPVKAYVPAAHASPNSAPKSTVDRTIWITLPP